MAKKPLLTTTVTVHGLDNPIVFADAISNGVTVRYGSIAKQQILNGETVDANNTIIPYHAIIKAEITETEGTYTEPEDAFCKAE